MRSSSPGSAGCLWQCTVTQNHDVKLQMGGTAPPPLHEYYTAVPRCHGSASLEGREVQHSNGITVTSHTASQLSGIAPRYSHRLLLPGTDASSQPGAYVTARGHARERHHGGLSHDATGGKPGFRGLPRRHLGAGLPRRSRRVPSSSPVPPPPLTCGAAQHRGAGAGPAQAEHRRGEEHRFVIGVRRYQQRADAIRPRRRRRRPSPQGGPSPAGRVTAPQAARATEQQREQQRQHHRRPPAPRSRCHSDRRRAAPAGNGRAGKKVPGHERVPPLPLLPPRFSPPRGGTARPLCAETCPGPGSSGLPGEEGHTGRPPPAALPSPGLAGSQAGSGAPRAGFEEGAVPLGGSVGRAGPAAQQLTLLVR